MCWYVHKQFKDTQETKNSSCLGGSGRELGRWVTDWKDTSFIYFLYILKVHKPYE